MTILHIKCGDNGRIEVDLPDVVKAQLYPTPKGLRISQITFNNNKITPPKAFKLRCTGCGEEPPTSEIATQCNYCGNFVGLESIVFVEGQDGAAYCPSCVDRRFKGHDKTPFNEKIMKTILPLRNNNY